MEQQLTEGAKRAMAVAVKLAAGGDCQSVQPVHLLWGLVLAESQAAELLRGRGVDTRSLASLWPLPGTIGPWIDSADCAALGSHTGLPYSLDLQSVLHEARGLAARSSRADETDTVILLRALTSVASPAAQALQAAGVDSLFVAGSSQSPAHQDGEPINVDFRLELDGTAVNASTTDAQRSESAISYRVLDAAANRAREGLRVVEDFARFVLNDAHLTSRLKQCRHNLTKTIGGIGTDRLLATRDTGADVGTEITTPDEGRRSAPGDVAAAGFKRAQEAVRTLEEFGKLLDPALGAAFERIRYRLYTLEKAVLRTESNRRRLEGRSLYLLLTTSLCCLDVETVVRESVAGGVGIVQVREKEMPDRELLEHARRVRRWTREAGAFLVINDRPDVAVLCEADGVHVGQEELSVADCRRITGPDMLVGVSTHTIEQARAAVLAGTDYLGVGSVFASQTKPFENLAGVNFVRQVAAEITLPWFAIGGINANNVEQAIAAGASRIAVSGAICGAERPQLTSGEVVRKLNCTSAARSG